MWKRIERTLTSFRFVVILILVLVLATIAGAVFPQRLSPEEYRGFFGDTGYSVLNALGLTDIYHSSWFSVGLIVLSISAFLCTVRRFSLRPRRLGFTITHVSLVVLAASYGASQMLSIRGEMEIYEGESIAVFQAVGKVLETANPLLKRGDSYTLPFEVRLNDFRLEYYPPDPGYLVVFGSRNDAYEAVPVSRGATVRSPEGDYQATVEEVIPEYAYDPAAGTLRAASTTFNDPVIRLALAGPGGFREETWLFQKDPMVSRGRSFSDEEPGSIVLTSPRGDVLGSLSAQEGATTDVKGTSAAVEVLQAVPDFVIDSDTGTVGSRSEEWNNPAALVLVTGDTFESATFWVFALHPEFTMGRTDLPFEVSYQPSREDTLSRKIRDFQKSRLPVRMSYVPGERRIKSFKSDVSIIDGNVERVRREIMVNRPMTYRGYKLWQRSYDLERPDYTVLGVNKDPALPGILLGCLLLSVGVIMTYTVNPILDARSRERSDSTEA